MFFPEGQIRVRLYGEPCDMRKSFDGLQTLVRHGLDRDPTDGGLYVFVNRRATQTRVLYFDHSGFCIWAKRIEAGRFISDWSQVRTREMDWTGLKLLLENIEPGNQRKRYRLPETREKSRSNTSSNSDALIEYTDGSIAASKADKRD
jgi:transposase